MQVMASVFSSQGGEKNVLTFGVYDAHQARTFTRGFWVATGLLTAICLYISRSTLMLDYLGALILILTCLIPCYLWAKRIALGLPFYPLFALMHIMFYGFPLITAHTLTFQYSEGQRFGAAMWISFSLFMGMLVWLYFVNKPQVPAKEVLTFELPRGRQYLLDFSVTLLFSSVVVVMIILNHRFFPGIRNSIPVGLISLIRNASGAVSFLCIFIGFLRIGLGQMGGILSIVFCSVFGIYIVDQMAGLILMSAALLCIPAIIGYALGSQKIPFVFVSAFIVVFSFLNLSKAEMRYLFWEQMNQAGERVALNQYDDLFAEWSRQSWSVATTGEATFYHPDVDSVPIVERASLMHIFLIPYTQSPQPFDYMWGESYTVIPKLLIPRVLYKDKPFAHEGQILLNIHYGLQDRQTALKTFLAWGLLPEAQGNFGMMGVTGICMLIGLLLGLLSRWTMSVPIISYRNLVGAVTLFSLVDTETVGSLLVTSLFQSLIIVTAFSLVFMRRLPNPAYALWLENRERRKETKSSDKIHDSGGAIRGHYVH